jgi:hypothetical protein
VRLEQMWPDAHLSGNLGERRELAGAGDFEV